MAPMPSVYRAPMRSRSDSVSPHAAIERARRLGLCGFGQLSLGPAEADRLARRAERFADVADGSLVWTRDGDGLYWLGRIHGPYRFDAGGADVDLVHVRPCAWLDEPFVERDVPAAVVATFGRGGRNFQEIHDPSVGEETSKLWRRE